MPTKSGTIYQESNYTKFKVLNGNRGITPARMKKIKESIEQVGYIFNPICVNEKMEIIDGQGRFTALRELNMPIDYYIVKGAGINECISMNINMTNWKLEDYIYCYADMGYISYIWLKQLYIQYKSLGIKTILNACDKYICLNAAQSDHGSNNQNDKIREGRFQCNKQSYEEAVKLLEYCTKFTFTLKNLSAIKSFGRIDIWYIAIMFAARNAHVDNERLVNKFNECGSIKGAINVHDSLEELSRIYNYRLQGEKVYLANDYQRELDSRKQRGASK